MSGPRDSVRVPRLRSLVAAAFALTVLVALLAPGARAASSPAVRGTRGMVVSPEPHASRVGRAILEAGGNAVDAAVAVAFALSVTHPLAGNLGGGGFLLYRAADGRAWALDFRETAPRRLTAELLVDEDGRPIPGRSLEHGLAVGVPGSVAGLAEAHRRWGRLPWRKLLEPAIGLAEAGFEVPPWLAARFADSIRTLTHDPEARRIFTRDGEPYAAGMLFAQPELGRTLRRIAKHGAPGFYSGPVATEIARTVAAAGGTLDAEDLAAYRAVLREPLVGSYRGWRILTFPPPSSGGVVLLQMLGMLERFDPTEAGPGSSLAIHLLAEVARRSYADRSRWLGDPDFADVPVAALLDSDYLAARAATISPDRATASADLAPGDGPAHESDDTAHLSVADEDGDAVALTTTLNRAFGCGIVATGTGVLLNDEIDDFAIAPGMPNSWGLLGAEANAVAGGKRPLSSMTPTIVDRGAGSGRPSLVLGSPGGSKIITSVLEVLVNFLDHEMPLQESVDAPRIHHQWFPDRIIFEPRGLSDDVARALVRRGHRLEPAMEPIGNVNAIALAEDGSWLGAADPRREGLAVGR